MDRPTMSIAEMREGLKAGRRLIQEEWTNPKNILAVEQLVSEGVASATAWKYEDNFQCKVRYVTGKKED